MNDNQSNTQPQEEPNPVADELRARIELLQSRLYAAKIAYFNGSELDGKVPKYEDIAAIAKNLISTNYRLQKELYGEVRVRLSVAKLLRASSR